MSGGDIVAVIFAGLGGGGLVLVTLFLLRLIRQERLVPRDWAIGLAERLGRWFRHGEYEPRHSGEYPLVRDVPVAMKTTRRQFEPGIYGRRRDGYVPPPPKLAVARSETLGPLRTVTPPGLPSVAASLSAVSPFFNPPRPPRSREVFKIPYTLAGRRGGGRYHVDRTPGEGRAACPSSNQNLEVDSLIPLIEVPVELRCSRDACRRHWPQDGLDGA